MINDTQVVFRGIDHSQAVEEAVQKRAEKLARFSDQIQSLRVTVESPHNNHHKGKVYHVGVEAFMPNHDIVVNHDQHDKHAHEDIYVAIRDTFDAVERQIKDINGKERRQTRISTKLSELAAVPEVEDISDIDDIADIADIVSVDEYQESEAANQ
ncbi:MAG: ribosomal subunit interface protein [Pseudohongiellaceae bacterium]|jgi:ribosomal subunit interface protein